MKTTLIITLTATSLLGTLAHADVARSSASASTAAEAELVLAQNRTYVDVLAELESEGYSINEVKSTWLGRVKIIAQSQESKREIVVSRTTGEVMSVVILQVFANSDDTPKTAKKEEAATDEEKGTGVSAGVGVSVGLGTNLSTDGNSTSGSASGSADTGVSIGLGN